VHFSRSSRSLALTAALLTAIAFGARTASAEALLLVEADTGKVLHAENAGYPWYPASVTKVMTAYVTLKAVKEGRITLDKLVTVSPVAAAQQPSKMGFGVGTQVTIDNALKMLMVKSANDMAVLLAEGVSGSVERFADEMNAAAQRLGMTQSSFVNPNGLPADQQITSARDLAILVRAVFRELPEYEMYWRIPAIKFGKRTMRNYNRLIDNYPGADGMKTGFICASGFNLVATATRNGRRLIAVVLGAPSGASRAEKAAQLLERGFSGNALSWLMPSLGSVEALQPIHAAPPNLREEVCGKNRKRPASEADDDEDTMAVNPLDGDRSSAYAALNLSMRAKQGSLLSPQPPSMPPIVVYTGAPKKPRDPAVAAAPAGSPGANSLPATFATTPKPPAPKRAAKPKKPATVKLSEPPKDDAKAKPAAPPKPAARPAAAPAKPKTEAAATPKSGAAPAKPKSDVKPAAKPKPSAAATPTTTRQ
jgi:D-alanyl-D-alanine carboxypeptidase